MNDGVDFIFLENLFRTLPIANIRLVEFHLFTSELFHTTKALFAGIGKIIHDDDAVTLVEKFQYGMGADKPASAGNQNCFHRFILPPKNSL